MTTLTFYTNPMSRGQIARWMLEEVGAPYEQVLLEYGTTMKAPDYLSINPMGKVPAIKHGDVVVTEATAICLYLADAFPTAGLSPDAAARGDYFRWILFAAGPIEAAITNRAMGWQVPPDKKMMAGYGDFDDAVAVLERAITGKTFVAGDRFTAADVYVGATVDWGLLFGTLPKNAAFEDYIGPLRERAAYKRAKEIDMALMPKSD